ncbi:MAG: PQQ-dependent sugar dehydrogenase [Bacteroidales bacterium]|nr:PQQ-dependent sugar dehydrogenase [Bacteroidales bacterium]
MKSLFQSLLITPIIFFLHSGIMAQSVITQTPFPGVSVPLILGLEHAGDQSGYLYPVSQQGRIYRFDKNSSNPTAEIWLDITDRLVSGGERGLLGLAFHPDFADNGRFYVNYTAPSPLRTVISSFETDPETGHALPDSETILLVFNQPFTNHNGGDIAFGPDGYLYIASGDGGSGGDPQNNAQNTQNLLGAMLRIDVDSTSGELNYAIPPDNPFAGSPDGRDEIFAWGLRNPWRFSFDSQNGSLWAGDVGQNAWEWIHIIENGKNYGWRVIEGSHCFNPPIGCDTTGLEMPVFEYSQDNGDRSITGGFVYYGSKNPALYGKYIYGDFTSGRIWALDYDYENGEAGNNIELLDLISNVSSFGVDEEGEIYVLTYSGGSILSLLAVPVAPLISEPSGGDTVYNIHTISWEEGPVVDQYNLQVSQSPFFESLVIDENTAEPSLEITLPDGVFYARVKAMNEAGESNFSTAVQYIVTGTIGMDDIRPNTALFGIISIEPNPATSFVSIRFQLPEKNYARIIMYNSLGEKLLDVAEGNFTTGSHDIGFQINRLKPGLYFLKMSSNGHEDARKLLIKN